jgi:apolipoprotein N-acyltransferase
VETVNKKNSEEISNYLPLLWFFLGFGLFMFTRRSEIVPTIGITIVLAPIFILGFVRTQSTKRGIWFTVIGFAVSLNIALWGLFEVSDQSSSLIFNLIRSSLLTVPFSLPYIADKLIYPKFKDKGMWSTLTFPIFATAIYFLFSLEGPFDGDAVFAVFEQGPAIFRQIASIAGLWGFVFIFSWFASIVNYSWEQKAAWAKIKKHLIVFSSILLIILLFGAIKTSSLISPELETVKLASIVLIPEDGKTAPMDEIYRNKTLSPFEESMSKIENLTKKAVLNDAKIVTFQEYSMTVNEEGENRLRKQSQRIAKENDIYFSITYGIFQKEGKGENKQLLINNQGQIEIDYTKRYLLGLGEHGETGVFKKGQEVIQTADTHYGRIGISICRDMSFPPYIRQAGKMNVDIMLGPSYDFPKSTSCLYSLRSIENGFSFVRPVYNGISFAVDYNGKLLARMDSDKTEDGILYANVPTKGIQTIYPIIGDLLGWLCVLGAVAFVVISIRGSVRLRR